MKYQLLLFIIYTTVTHAQIQFQEVNPTPFDGVYFSDIAYADIDNDNDLDVLITGFSNTQQIAKLYLNNGNGDFTLVNGTPFTATSNGSIAFADIDGDNDQDLLITGKNNNSGNRIAELYTNDGSGNFTLVSSPFDGVEFSSIAFADIDNDNDLDVMITGLNVIAAGSTKLYINDGNGNFSVEIGTPFDLVGFSAIAFSDIDGDNDQDVLITGQYAFGQYSSTLYTNDGFGTFTLVTGTPFEGVAYSAISFSDIDGDNDQDVLITGKNMSGSAVTKLYVNNGSGAYTLDTGTSFENLLEGDISFADLDNDNDMDVIITGQNNSSQKKSNLYINDGSGTYIIDVSMPFDNVEKGSTLILDIDNDNDKDVIISGLNSSNQRISKLYKTCFKSTGIDTRTECKSYTWIDGITYTNDNNTATFNILGGNTQGCDSMVTLDLTISTINVSLTWSGASITSNNTSATSYQWIKCDNNDAPIVGEISPMFNATENGDYAVIITEGNCSDTSVCVNIAGLNIFENSNSKINIFPNPTKGNINITITQNSDITIFNSFGKLIYFEKLNSGNNEIDFSDFSNGTYFIEIVSENNVSTHKIIKL